MEQAFKPSLETRAFGTPLLKFKALLKDYEVEERTADNRAYKVIKFNFIDLEVIESTEPYPFPIASIEIGYNPNEGTKWAVFAKSISKVFGHVPSIDDLVGKIQVWHYGPAKLRLPDEQGIWDTRDGQAWLLESIDGIEGGSTEVDITAHILGLLDGKTEADFYQVLYVDPITRQHPDIITAATDRKLLDTLQSAGKAERDDQGIWHKV